MVILRQQTSILYLHGFNSRPGDEIEKSLGNVKSILLDHMNPEKTYRDVLQASKGVEIVIGFSMGGFWASLIPGIKTIFINPAFLFPYILLKKIGSRNLFERYLEIGKNQFKDCNKDSKLIYWPGDKTEPLGLFNAFYGGKVIGKLKGHVPSVEEIKKIIIPEIVK